MGNRSEIGTVRLEHEAVIWHGFGAVLNDLAVLEGDDSSEAHEMPLLDQRQGLFSGSGEAMEDTAQLSRPRQDLGREIFKALPIMKHDIELQLGGELKLCV